MDEATKVWSRVAAYSLTWTSHRFRSQVAPETWNSEEWMKWSEKFEKTVKTDGNKNILDYITLLIPSVETQLPPSQIHTQKTNTIT